MSEKQPHKTRQALAQARPLLPLLAVLLAVLALWLAWSGWEQLQDESRRGMLTQARDGVAQATARSVNAELERLSGRLASPPVRSALATGDLEAASAALAADWPNLEELSVYGPDLESVYAGLGESGFGRAAVLEAALVEGRPVAWVIREDDAPRLALAAPARADGTLVGAAFARLPLARATLATEQAIDNMVAHIQTFADTAPTHTVEGNVAAGARRFTVCAYCHGANGQGIQAMNAPRLAGISDWYLEHQIRNFKRGIRGEHPEDYYGKQMGFMGRIFQTDQSINDVVAYINTLDAPSESVAASASVQNDQSMSQPSSQY